MLDIGAAVQELRKWSYSQLEGKQATFFDCRHHDDETPIGDHTNPASVWCLSGDLCSKQPGTGQGGGWLRPVFKGYAGWIAPESS